jgi:hypothetical protein
MSKALMVPINRNNPTSINNCSERIITNIRLLMPGFFRIIGFIAEESISKLDRSGKMM